MASDNKIQIEYIEWENGTVCAIHIIKNEYNLAKTHTKPTIKTETIKKNAGFISRQIIKSLPMIRGTIGEEREEGK